MDGYGTPEAVEAPTTEYYPDNTQQQQYDQTQQQQYDQQQYAEAGQEQYVSAEENYYALIGEDMRGTPAAKYDSPRELANALNNLALFIGGKFEKEVSPEAKEALFKIVGNQINGVPEDPSQYQFELPQYAQESPEKIKEIKEGFQQALRELGAGAQQAQPIIDFSMGMAETFLEEHITNANDNHMQECRETFGEELHGRMSQTVSDLLNTTAFEEVTGASNTQIIEQMQKEGTILGPTAWFLLSTLSGIVMAAMSPSYGRTQLPTQYVSSNGGKLSDQQLKLIAQGMRDPTTPGYRELRSAIANAHYDGSRE